MHKKLVSLAFVLFVAGTISAQETVQCESSDGKYRECATNTTGRLVMTRQLSDTNCIEGKNWGYRDGVVWVDSGCRGEFAVSQRGQMLADRLVVCESDNNTRSVCRTNTGGGVAVARQLSRNACVRGKTWGYDGDSIWVDDGCRAEFVIGKGNDDRTFERLSQMVRCESIDGKPARCLADTTAGVQVVRQLSDNSCRYGRHWGYDENGIWVAEGCRAEFAVRAPQVADAKLTLLCESENNGRKHCRADTSQGITLVRQLSDNLCARNRSWGVDKDGVWVTEGCRAEFSTGYQPMSMTSSAPPPDGTKLTCESKDGKRFICPADTQFGVALVRQTSEAPCILDRTWGYTPEGIWVTSGCRAEFVLRE
jgi:Protein of unknown function (DUF3011)